MRKNLDELLREKYKDIQIEHDFSICNHPKNVKFHYSKIYKIVAGFIILGLITLNIYFINTKIQAAVAKKSNLEQQNINVNEDKDKISENVSIASEKESKKADYVITVSGSSTFNTKDINLLFEKTELIVTGTVTEKMKAEKNYYLPLAVTPGNLLIDNVIKGKIIEDNIRFIVSGGIITFKQYEDSLVGMDALKLKINSMTEEEKTSKFVEFKSEDSIEFKVGQRYILFLNKIEGTDDYLTIGCYGMIPISDSDDITNVNQIKEKVTG